MSVVGKHHILSPAAEAHARAEQIQVRKQRWLTVARARLDFKSWSGELDCWNPTPSHVPIQIQMQTQTFLLISLTLKFNVLKLLVMKHSYFWNVWVIVYFPFVLTCYGHLFSLFLKLRRFRRRSGSAGGVISRISRLLTELLCLFWICILTTIKLS